MIRQAESDLEQFLNRKYPGRKVWVEGGAIVIRIPMVFKKRGGRKEIISPGIPSGLPEGADAAGPPDPQPQRPLVVALAKAHAWQKMIESGEVGSIKELAQQNHVNPSYVARILRLATLAPDIVEAILAGTEPDGLSLRALSKNIPLLWDEQQEMFGFVEK
jgi:hypothetical protein